MSRASETRLVRWPASCRRGGNCAVALGFAILAACTPAARDDERERMVTQQLESREITDPRVLAAMRSVRRHAYVPPDVAHLAYGDHPLPIGQGQTISQPFVVAFMTEALRLDGDERVLEVGTGSGYQAAVLAVLAREVYTIEILPELAERARKTLAAEGFANVRVRAGDGYQGWPEASPFDAIVVTAAVDHVPQPLLVQLAPGGRMVLPLGPGSQELVLIESTPEGIQRRTLLPVRFVPMTGEAQSED